MVEEKKSVFALVLSISIAVFVWTQMLMYAAHLLLGINLHMNIFKFCTSLFKENSILYTGVVVALNGLIIYTVLMTLFRLVQQYILTRKFGIRLQQLHIEELTETITSRFGRKRGSLRVISQEQPLAFTAGFRNPCIVLSTGLLRMLDPCELEAVIEHETFHQQNFDARKLFVLQLISQGLWFIPLTRWSYQNYQILSELLADHYAIRRMGSELGLGSALLKLIKTRMPDSSAAGVVCFSGYSVNYRLQQLLNPEENIPVRLEIEAIVISISMLLMFLTMTVLAVA